MITATFLGGRAQKKFSDLDGPDDDLVSDAPVLAPRRARARERRMEYVHNGGPYAGGGGWRRAEQAWSKTWQAGGLDLHKPISPEKPSSYQRMLAEVKDGRGVFSMRKWDGTALEPPYVPPWRQTMSEVYGMETYKRMHAPVMEYEARTRMIAEEEAARRRGNSP